MTSRPPLHQQNGPSTETKKEEQENTAKQKSFGMFLFKKPPSLDFNCLDYPVASVKIIKICLNLHRDLHPYWTCHQTHRKGLCRKESASRGKVGITL